MPMMATTIAISTRVKPCDPRRTLCIRVMRLSSSYFLRLTRKSHPVEYPVGYIHAHIFVQSGCHNNGTFGLHLCPNGSGSTTAMAPTGNPDLGDRDRLWETPCRSPSARRSGWQVAFETGMCPQVTEQPTAGKRFSAGQSPRDVSGAVTK